MREPNAFSRRHLLLAATATAAVAQTTTDPADLTLAEAAALIRRKRLSPVELTEACLRRTETRNPKLNAFITVTAPAAMAEARAREAELRRGGVRGPLHGIPIAVKDLFDTAGVRTTAASAHWAERVPPRDADVVRRLRDAGAVLTGKLNMDEFAYNFTSETSHFGPIRNPWNPALTPGGSSGGSAVAVAAGMCLGALGSDTGGSIRLPAALCGITGFKPSYGAVSTEGATPLAWSLDHVGPMCRTAEDAALLFDAIRIAPRPESVPDARRLRIGTPRSLFFDALQPDVTAAVEEAIRVFGNIGASRPRAVDLPPLAMIPDLPVLPKAYGTIIYAEAHAFHADMLRAAPERYHPGTRRNLEFGAPIGVPEYARARLEMDRLRREIAAVFTDVDVLLMPAAPGVAFPLGSRADLVYLRNTAPWNLYGLPAISVPCGFSRDGLPIGLQLVGRAGADDTVLAAARHYQSATDWHRRRAPTA